MNKDNTPTLLATTGAITVNDTLGWDAVYSVGEEMVYPFWIDVSQEKKLGEFDRIFLKIKVTCDSCAHLMHSNDATWEDVKIDIPFRL